MAVSLSASVRNWRKGRDNHTDREGPQTTQLSLSRRVLPTAGKGHEDQFLPPKLSARSVIRKQTVAATQAMGETRRYQPFECRR